MASSAYGDLGIAVTLLGAARHAGEPAWESEALDIARSAARLPVPAVRAVDAGLCHGAAGVAHLFNRVFQATGDPVCRAAARTWIERTLELAQPGTGVGGYRSWSHHGQAELAWRDDPGFLTGAAGVGLALLAAATPAEPAWDRLLLASVPPHS